MKKFLIELWAGTGNSFPVGEDELLTNGIGFFLFADTGVLLLYKSETLAARDSVTHLDDVDDLDFGTIQAFKLFYNY